MPAISMHDVVKVLIADRKATVEDARILERFAEQKLATRAELDSAVDLIEKSDLSEPAKKSALRELTGYFESTATGLEAKLFGVEVSLVEKLVRQGIENNAKFIEKAATPAQRTVLANACGVNEKEIRQAVKQVDLQRVDGISPKLARVLVSLSVDSTLELGRTDVDKLFKKLQDFSKTMDSWVIKFKLPKKSELEAWAATARTLPRAVEFGRADSGFAALPVADRARMMIDEDAALNSTYPDFATANAYLDDRGLGAMKARFREHHLEVCDNVANELDYAGVHTTGEKILDGRFQLDDDSSYSFGVEPSITEFKDSSGNLVGASFQWEINDGSESNSWRLIFDKTANKFTAMHWSETANGESETTLLDD